MQDEVKFIQNYFFETFVIQNKQFGPLALGYFAPFKEIPNLPLAQQEEVLKWLTDLMKSCAVIGGDLNSSPTAVSKLLDQLSLTAGWFNEPTYLFSAPQLSEDAPIPCFDNFLILDPEISDFQLETLLRLPDTVNQNPRQLMGSLGSPSDHIPVICHLSKQEAKLRLGFYNVADPTLWGQQYPTAADGFDLTPEGEQKRILKLQPLIKTLIEKSDITGLVEVPVSLKEWLEEQAKTYSKKIHFEKMVETEKDNEGLRQISQVQPPNASYLGLIH